MRARGLQRSRRFVFMRFHASPADREGTLQSMQRSPLSFLQLAQRVRSRRVQ